MKLLLNEKNEISNYILLGDIDGTVEYDGEIPDDFEDSFKPTFYMLKDGEIVENPDYVEPKPPVISPSEQDKINAQIMLTQAKQKEDQDKFNAQILLKLAGGMK
ncbi:DUF2977 domain-containing protein [Pediococcus acidilactici]|uniref:DUF2977 domain-containing protein n=1 Tax=Pediococcus acidilactici TaxID=1254 RepID=UPI000326FA29|nr:DUF2977 domain-containing protein [Pediococcus acidilactici]EOA09451.1 hypothetical protein PAD3_0544 [Pediococcus acidilactici D3]MBW4796928.1 DUF2977 domain-containing protein [Pediococcus acidilactici]MBW9306180.1 DUF2977 domain-containing protein [Pediococcus acidilactici]MCE5961398.1 DUF2977 domain-containing protein [Pediococcus acidilactici]MCW8082327.1 DUF2977 domain-containing protein [Pediococcus acidilactici]